jgi:hypothetical protein
LRVAIEEIFTDVVIFSTTYLPLPVHFHSGGSIFSIDTSRLEGTSKPRLRSSDMWNSVDCC